MPRRRAGAARCSRHGVTGPMPRSVRRRSAVISKPERLASDAASASSTRTVPGRADRGQPAGPVDRRAEDVAQPGDDRPERHADADVGQQVVVAHGLARGPARWRAAGAAPSVTNSTSSPTVLITRPPWAVTTSEASASNRCTTCGELALGQPPYQRGEATRGRRSPTLRTTPGVVLLRARRRRSCGRWRPSGAGATRRPAAARAGRRARSSFRAAARAVSGSGTARLVSGEASPSPTEPVQASTAGTSPSASAISWVCQPASRSVVRPSARIIASAVGSSNTPSRTIPTTDRSAFRSAVGEHRVLVADVGEAQGVPELAGTEQRRPRRRGADLPAPHASRGSPSSLAATSSTRTRGRRPRAASGPRHRRSSRRGRSEARPDHAGWLTVRRPQAGGRTWTTSPAAWACRPAGPSSTSRPESSTATARPRATAPEGWCTRTSCPMVTHGRGTAARSPLRRRAPADPGSRAARRGRRGRRATQVLPAHAGDPAQPQRRRRVHRQLLAALVHVDARAGDDQLAGRPPRASSRMLAEHAADRRRRRRARRSATSAAPAPRPPAAARAAIAIPVSSGSHPRSAPAIGTTTDTATDAPAGASQCRASRPRPALWWSATTTRHGSGRRAASRLVESSVAWPSTPRHGLPGVSNASRRARRPGVLAHRQG